MPIPAVLDADVDHPVHEALVRAMEELTARHDVYAEQARTAARKGIYRVNASDHARKCADLC